ncbi:MAG TPA: hypothetical protein VIW23_12935 [Candidatus Acidoferrum sp.]
MVPKKIWVRSALFVTVLFFFCSNVLSQTEISASLIQLIANPEKYDGRQLEVIGFLRLEFEGDRIYLHEDDYKYNIGDNGIRIGLTKKQRQDFENRNMHYVFLVGTFKAGKGGTSNANGSIVNITKIEIWPLK